MPRPHRASACLLCPSGTDSPQGSDDISDCVCSVEHLTQDGSLANADFEVDGDPGTYILVSALTGWTVYGNVYRLRDSDPNFPAGDWTPSGDVRGRCAPCLLS
eukprot:1347887-Rhodomonas_salina.2